MNLHFAMERNQNMSLLWASSVDSLRGFLLHDLAFEARRRGSVRSHIVSLSRISFTKSSRGLE